MMLLALLSVPTVAAATLEDTFVLTCNDLNLRLTTTLDASLYGLTFPVIDDERDVPMDCNGVAEADIAVLEADAEAECDASGIGLFGVDCADAAALFRASMEDLNADLDGLVPSGVRLVRRKQTPKDRIYRGYHDFPDGSRARWGYLVHRDGPAHRSLRTNRVATPDPEVGGLEAQGFTCVTGASSRVDGTALLAADVWSLEAWFKTDIEVDCDQSYSGGALYLVMDQTLTADLTGTP